MKKKKTRISRNKNNYSNVKLFEYLNNLFICLFIVLLPTQFGKHFFFSFSFLNGVRVDYLAPTIYLTDILAILLIILNFKTLITFLINKKVLVITGLLLINIVFSISPIISLYKLVKILEIASIGIITYRSFIKLNRIMICFLLGAIFELVLSVFQLNLGHSIQGIFYYFGERPLSLSTPGVAIASFMGRVFLRPYATFSHPNSMAGFYLLLYIFFLSIKNKVKQNLLFITYFLLFVISCLIFISFSKVAIITYLLLNTYYLILVSKIPCRFCIIARLLGLTIVGSIFMLAHTDPLTIQKRIELITNSLTIISQHPIFGVGLGNYLITQQLFSSHFLYFFNQPVHNIFLLLIAELGIPITITILIIVIKLLKNVPLNSYPPAGGLILASVLLTGFFDHYWLTLQQNMLLLGVVGGLMFKVFRSSSSTLH